MRSDQILLKDFLKILPRKDIFVTLAIIFSFSSCYVSSETRYFKTLTKDTVVSAYISPGLDSRIQKNDLLGINVSSLSANDDALYKPPPVIDKAGYKVDQDGNIYFHRLGAIKAEGLTRKELSDKIQRDLRPFLTDAIVSVNFLNHKITVAGEITSPKILQIEDDQITLIDALVSCGDLKSTSLRTDVLIIRDSTGKKIVKHVNLEDHAIINSPWYYLQPNDIVIVNPDTRKAERDERRSRFQSNFAIITSAISLTIVILSRFL